jgi:hypothetical protein
MGHRRIRGELLGLGHRKARNLLMDLGEGAGGFLSGRLGRTRSRSDSSERYAASASTTC